MKSNLLATLAVAATFVVTASAQKSPTSQKQPKGVITKTTTSPTKPSTQNATAGPAAPNNRVQRTGVGQAFVGGSDNCATAELLVGAGPYAFDNSAATTGAQGQSEALCNFFALTGIAHDVWFRWNATFTGTARVHTCGQTSIDSKIAVYAGTACPAGSALACDDDACDPGLQTSLTFACTSGQPYVIQLGNYPGGTPVPGTGTFTITQVIVPVNDDCATPTVIAGGGPFAFDTTSATTGTQGQTESACDFFGFTAIAKDTWYRWNAGFTGTARVDFCAGATSDTKIAAYSGSVCPAAAALACNDDNCALQSRINFPVTMGQNYVIQVGGYPGGGGASGSGTFTITQFIAPPGDECSGSVLIAGAGPHNFDTTNATQGTQGQADCLCDAFGTTNIDTDLWYRWQAPSTGRKVLSLCAGGGTLDTRVAVYSGSVCPAAGALACDDDFCAFAGPSEIAWNAISGNFYMIQLGSYPGGGGGAGTFTINPGAAPVGNDACSAPTAISGAGPHPFDNTAATSGSEGQCETACDFFGTTRIENDVWFRWTAGFTGPAQVNSCTGATHDSKIAVYNGSVCPAAAAAGCDDDDCGTIGGPSRTIFSAVNGQQYMIQLGNYPGAPGGTGTFTIDPYVPPPGDLCTSPILISGPGTYNYDNTSATTGTEGQNESICLFFATTNIADDLWYRWSSTCTGSVTVSLCAGGGAHDSKLAVYSGSTCPSSAALACDDDFCGFAIESEVVFNATSGQTYMIQLGSFPGAGGAAGTFAISCTSSSPMTQFCLPGQGGVMPCPCSNPPAGGGLGCNNHGAGPAASGTLNAVGNPSLGADTIQLQITGENNTSLTTFWQGQTATPVAGVKHGAGVRCVSVNQKRLYTGSPSGGSINRPIGTQLSVSARTAAVGATITAGQTRRYYAVYRDPNAAGPCGNTSDTINTTNAGAITWAP